MLKNVEKHSKMGERVKSIVFGGMDGIITTFAVVAGASGGGLPISTILILGISNKIADGFSMGIGDALSSKSENEFILREREREQWYAARNRSSYAPSLTLTDV
jgi:VIT1/CCC1 family predicted Fe2+/Mn2+ transporter